MLIVGLTGGIATGKSLATKVLRDLGAHVIDADKIVHELLAPGQSAWREVVARFGPAVQLPGGAIDRRKLGDIVFRDAAERAWLNSAIHPRVFEAYQAQVRHIRDRDSGAIVVFDAALLIETGYHKKADRLIVVYADRDLQIQRLIERDGLTPEQAAARIDSQMPVAEKRAYADFVIDNNGTREDTERQVRAAYASIKELAGGKETL